MNASSLGPVLATNEHLRGWLNQLATVRDPATDLLPWTARLPAVDLNRLRRDLLGVLEEPEETGEPIDWEEIADILQEYADLVHWEGPLLLQTEHPLRSKGFYTVDLPAQSLKYIERASADVQSAVQEVLDCFLRIAPADPAQLSGYRIKKLPERDLFQIDLPDAYRLRYLVDDLERTVYVVYLGPHPSGAANGREKAVRAMINRRRNGDI